ncbi:MAG: 2-oxo-3-hexenedioate decarboxylase [Pseudomonadota bacterium]|nr:2-oxo-3-hexenedioate decarboxylase [Pseudomonadota bacterium]
MSKPLAPEDLARIADRLERAERQGAAIPKVTDDYPGLGLSEAYAVQSELRRRRVAAGERVVGWKAGLTSKAKMVQMGVNVPGIGFLTSAMACPENSAVSTQRLIHPRVECEVAFMMRDTLRGRDCTREEVLAATAFVFPALEIIDSRFAGFKFDLHSVMADNASSARFVGGGRARRVHDLDLRSLGVVMEKNGRIVATASAAAVMGHPADAVALLVAVLADMDEELPGGSIVLSGGITEAIPVAAGDSMVARFQELGSVSVHFE